MNSRRRRSELARQRRWVRRHVRLNSFQDKRLAESVNLLGGSDIRSVLNDKFDSVWIGASLEFTRGEILSNQRGEGSLQQVMDDELEET